MVLDRQEYQLLVKRVMYSFPSTDEEQEDDELLGEEDVFYQGFTFEDLAALRISNDQELYKDMVEQVSDTQFAQAFYNTTKSQIKNADFEQFEKFYNN